MHRLISQAIAGKDFVIVMGDESVRHVACLMKERRANAVLVVGGQQALAGICTERDIVVGMVAAGLEPDRTKVGDIMTPHPQTLTADKPLCHALHMMHECGFHHVPIVDERGRPLGMLTARDALCMDALEFENELVQREDIFAAL